MSKLLNLREVQKRERIKKQAFLSFIAPPEPLPVNQLLQDMRDLGFGISWCDERGCFVARP